jgi:hypothetical protein
MHARDPAEAVEVLNLLLKFFGDCERWIKAALAIVAVTAVLSARSISSAAITRSKATRPSGIWPMPFPTRGAGAFVDRIRHYGLFANGNRATNITRARELLAVPSRSKQTETSTTAAADEPRVLPRPCRCCSGRMIIIETFARGCQPKHRPAPATAAIRIDTS